MSGDPLLLLEGDIHERLEVGETELSAVSPCTGLILERTRKGRRKERALLAHILLDPRLDDPTSRRGRQSFG